MVLLTKGSLKEETSVTNSYMMHNSHEQHQSNKMFLLGFTLTANYDL